MFPFWPLNISFYLSACFLIPNIFSNSNFNCSDAFDLRNLHRLKNIVFQKLFWPFTVQIIGKSPEVPYHGITSPYSYFEIIWTFSPIQQEAKDGQEKLSAEQSWKVTRFFLWKLVSVSVTVSAESIGQSGFRFWT